MFSRLMACFGLAFGLAFPAAAQTTIIHAGTLLVSPGEPALTDASLVIRDGRVAGLSTEFLSADDLDEDGTVTVIDLSDRFVLPGLIDAHVHLAGVPGESVGRRVALSDEFSALRAADHAARTLKSGFTTVRDLGSPGQSVIALKQAIDEGHAIGPRIVTSGDSIAITGGHGDISGLRKDLLEGFSRSQVGVCDSAAECRQRVRERSKFGATVIKITATGGVLSQQGRGLEQHFTDGELEAITESAHFLGLKVAAHAHGAGGVNAALRAGVDSIEHGTYLNADSIELFQDTGAYLVPTLRAFTGIKEGLEKGFYTPVVAEKVRTVVDLIGQGLRAAHAAGVKIAFGTDAGVFDHGLNAEEFQLMVDYGGMTPEETVISATVSAADLLGDPWLGALDIGYHADVIAVDGNPLDDVTVLENPSFVMKGGAVYLQR